MIRANEKHFCEISAVAFWTEPNNETIIGQTSLTQPALASGRAKVEHPFRVLKCQWGYRKARYRGLAKNAAQLWSLFGLANVYLARKKLLALS
jgi:IS5 family transposase